MNGFSGILPARVVALAAALALCASPAVVHAAGYLKIGDIKGESTDKDHKGEIEILSWSWGQTRSPRNSGTASGRRQHRPITITKAVDQASPKLREASSSGRPFPKMELMLPSKEGKAGEYQTYELTNVVVSAYTVNPLSAGEHASSTESFTLTYEDSTVKATAVQHNVTDLDFTRERAREGTDRQ